MVERSPRLRSKLRPFRNYLQHDKTDSRYRAISADVKSTHGWNCSGIIFDELHTQPNRELWDSLTSGIAAREQPLVIAITTAGYDLRSLCWEQHEYARQVCEGTIEDPAQYAMIFAADKDDDWTDPAIWSKANPSFGETIGLRYMEDQCKKAQISPLYQNAFRRLHLNQWTAQRDRWLDMRAWDACGGTVDAKALEGRPCYAGLDLAQTSDLCALVLFFPPVREADRYEVLSFFWCPGDRITERSVKDQVPYDVWRDRGLITTTDGDATDYDAILEALLGEGGLAERYQILELAFDMWGAAKVVNALQGGGLKVVQFGQGFRSMSPPTKELLRMVLNKTLNHGNNAVLNWNVDNLVVRQDPAGNVKPDKEKSSEKIDGVVALIMALDRAVRNDPNAGRSVYEDRGLVIL